MSTQMNDDKGREPKVFMITDGRDYKYYIDPALEIIRHEGAGLFTYEGEFGHADIEITFVPDSDENETYMDKGTWRANGIRLSKEQINQVLYDEYCHG